MWDRREDEERRESQTESAIPAGPQSNAADSGTEEVAELQCCRADPGHAEPELGGEVEPTRASHKRTTSCEEGEEREHGEAEPGRRPDRAEHRHRHRRTKREEDEEGTSVIVDPSSEEEIARYVDEGAGGQDHSCGT